VLVGTVENHLVGPYVLPRRLNVDSYLFLNEVLSELVEEIPLAIRRKICNAFMIDASAYYVQNAAQEIREF
jgi:hypothetical protein